MRDFTNTLLFALLFISGYACGFLQHEKPSSEIQAPETILPMKVRQYLNVRAERSLKDGTSVEFEDRIDENSGLVWISPTRKKTELVVRGKCTPRSCMVEIMPQRN